MFSPDSLSPIFGKHSVLSFSFRRQGRHICPAHQSIGISQHCKMKMHSQKERFAVIVKISSIQKTFNLVIFQD